MIPTTHEITPATRAQTLVVEAKDKRPGFERYKREFLIYDYEGKKGVWLSKKERVLCEAYLDSNFNYSYAARAVRGVFATRTTETTVRAWLDRKEHIQDYINHRVIEKGYTNGYTKERWLLEAADYRDGRREANRATTKMHEMIGRAMGWMVDQQNTFTAQNMVIDFRQSDGKE